MLKNKKVDSKGFFKKNKGKEIPNTEVYCHEFIKGACVGAGTVTGTVVAGAIFNCIGNIFRKKENVNEE